jgi:hypothetical protein
MMDSGKPTWADEADNSDESNMELPPTGLNVQMEADDRPSEVTDGEAKPDLDPKPPVTRQRGKDGKEKESKEAKENHTLRLKVHKLEADKRNWKSENEKMGKANEALLNEITHLRGLNAQINVNLQEKESTIADLTNELKNLKTRIVDQNVEKAELTEELAKISKRLEDSETVHEELLQQLDLSASSSFYAGKMAGLFMYDAVTEAIGKTSLSPEVEWSNLRISPGDKWDNIDFSQYDIIVVMVGSEDVRSGASGQSTFKRLDSLLQTIGLEPKVAIVEIVPSNVKGASGAVSIVNFRLSKIERPEFQMIELQLKDFPKDQILNNDALTTKAIDHIRKRISEQLDIPDFPPRKKTKPNTKAHGQVESFEVASMIPLAELDVGKVIGRSGSVISKLSKENSVTMTIGRWSEPKRSNKRDFEVITDAVLVKGNVTNVKNVQEMVADLIQKPTTA